MPCSLQARKVNVPSIHVNSIPYGCLGFVCTGYQLVLHGNTSVGTCRTQCSAVVKALTHTYLLLAERLSLTWSLGNLTLLTGPTNSQLQNYDYDVKCNKLQYRAVKFVTAALVYNGNCAKGTVWSALECRDRGSVMIK